MHTISVLTKNIILEPKHLTPNIKEYIFSELKKKYEKVCCDESGLIISIDRIITIDNIINKDSINITFMVQFEAHTIKPEKNMKISFIPTLILSKGIFGKLYENINFFIPETTLLDTGYKFDNDTSSFTHEQKDTITCKTEVNVTIDQLKYDTLKYNCIVLLD